MQEFSPEHKGCNVRCTAEVLKGGKKVPCGMLFKWTGGNGTTSLSNHIQRCHPNTYAKEHVAACNSSEAREERAQDVVDDDNNGKR